MGTLLVVAWQRYLHSLGKRPLITKAITSGTLAAVADVLAQKMGGAKHLQPKKSALMAVYGLCFGGPTYHFFHKIMDRVFGAKTDPSTVIQKVVVEQLTFGVMYNLAILTYRAYVVEGLTWAATKAKVRRDYWGVQKQGWKLWPLVAFINYSFLPPQLRVLFANVLSIFWVCFLIMRSKVATVKDR
ncbi:Mpv17 / PMP22 family domain containing protein [Klebsormidium nitens]|uniref:Mpv17 / PMP22 family domain containing protein n=1 Tax=Klebsormidium nitens TaxID=105231 RepID=A0A1Y1IBF0_KLENI|nr:Mpv17 / PMP22 family domain containing protein [Klebsormidium nitens]|eukprot:GAQ86036.1 Mpv17 / PMP22 family domain containing protein [Klebsormidium nitens]